MTSEPAIRLLRGHTIHERFAPFRHRFRYRLVLVDVDIDRLDEAGGQSRLFGADRPGLFSFRQKDHGDRSGEALREWATAQFHTAGIEVEGAVRLVTFPRHLFYKFAPISLWLGYSLKGDLRGVIYEVNNTFGDSHAYVAPCDAQGGRHEADKKLHVSPFFDRDGSYRFALRTSQDRLGLTIDHQRDGERLHLATIAARTRPATSGEFLKAAISMPLSSLGVSLGIHWEALKLWVRGAGYRSRPAPTSPSTTIAEPLHVGHNTGNQ